MFTFIWFSVQNSCSFSKELVTKTESSWSCQTFFFFSFCLVAKFLSPHYSHTFLTSLFFSFFSSYLASLYELPKGGTEFLNLSRGSINICYSGLKCILTQLYKSCYSIAYFRTIEITAIIFTKILP